MPDGPVSPLFGLGQRLPPSNIQAEQAFLGALLANNKVADRCGALEAEHFADPINGRIYAEARRLIDAGRLADAVTLKSAFEHAGVLEEVGGTAYLAQLLSAMVGIANAGDYARVIRDAWVRRQTIDIIGDSANLAFGAVPEMTADDVVTETMDRLLTLSEGGSETTTKTFADATAAAILQTQAAHRGDAGHQRLDTGIAAVDRLWGGLWPGQLYKLVARSNTGKTPLLLQIARHVAAQLDRGVVHIWSLEMTAEDLVRVNLASTTRWTVDQIQAGQIGNAAAWLEYERAGAELARLPIVIDDPAEITMPELARRTRATRRTKGTRLVLIDFRELIRRPRNDQRMPMVEWVPMLSYQLKALAKATGVPIVALCQINKPSKGEAPAFPTINDLPYGGEQAADGVFGLHRPELYMPDEPPNPDRSGSAEKKANAASAWEAEKARWKGVAEFGVIKRRFGAHGRVKLRFDGPRMLFSDMPDSLPPDLLNIPSAQSEGDYGD